MRFYFSTERPRTIAAAVRCGPQYCGLRNQQRIGGDSGQIVGPGDAELLHAEARGARFEIQQTGRAVRAFHDAPCLAEDGDEMLALDLLERRNLAVHAISMRSGSVR